MQQDIEMALDLNKDGKIDKDDFKIAYDKVTTTIFSFLFTSSFFKRTPPTGSHCPQLQHANWRRFHRWFNFGAQELIRHSFLHYVFSIQEMQRTVALQNVVGHFGQFVQ